MTYKEKTQAIISFSTVTMPEKNGETYLKYTRKENVSQEFVSGKTDFQV